MNRRAELFGGSPPEMRGQRRQVPEQPEFLEGVEQGFFQDAVSFEELERSHPLGPEARPTAQREKDRQKAQGVFAKIRSSPLTRPLFFALALIVGMEAAPRNAQSKETEVDAEVESVMLDPGVRQEFVRLVYSELRESGQTFSEAEGRFGRDSWTPEEQQEYDMIISLEGRFEYLHKDHPEIVDAYRDPQGRLENAKTLFLLMTSEFRHSRLAFDFLNQTIDDAVSVFPRLEPSKAMEIYTEYEKGLFQYGGLKSVQELAKQLQEKLPQDHPILAQIEAKQWLAVETQQWFAPSKDNFVIFNQITGRVEIYHKANDAAILLEAFPGNGGPPNGQAWERGMAAHIAVRTPDGNYSYDRSFEKKSPSWQFSWVTDTAPLRWTADKKDVEYQDTDGKWRRLTGEYGEFMVYGAPQHPFLEEEKSSLYRSASQREQDGSWKRPVPFTVESALGPDGELRQTWDRNDFGSRSIQIRDESGQVMSIFFHSSPLDEKWGQFLDFSHGCIHMKPEDLEAMDGYLAKGSKMRISSESAVAKTEKPGSGSEPKGG